MPRLSRGILPLHNKEKLPGPQTTNGAPGPTASRHRSFAQVWRNELVAMAAEFAGTFMFLFFAFGGTQVANTSAIASDPATAGQQDNSITQAPNTSVLLFIALTFGFSLMVNVWVFFRVSGGLFNPAVTLGLYLIGAISPIRAGLCFLSQMLAGMCSAGIVSAILPGPLNVSTTLGANTSIAQGVFLEMFLTSLLVFTIFMLAAEKHKATFLAPVGIGLALFVAELVGVFYTGGSLNPARSFGPCVVTKNFPGYHYIYWFGPTMGTLLAWGMYRIVKSVEYQTVNPGQDFDDHEAALFKPPSNPDSAAQVERPNVAAIAVEEAVRMASRGEHEGIDRQLSSEGPSSRLSDLGREAEGAAHGSRA
ncbi:aquaporin-like protein [Lophiostoma macrostomum CBS 122681]|uniref:Aquaporin-like protein n=1 Tax=Lophiostoma macrostomum CBS 122681 TaxID=1314788 RepID=A0A6A6TQ93_9PLEO|nr:aquaporin-like protein [Lophiostoma macrostomum CBS 122681]